MEFLPRKGGSPWLYHGSYRSEFGGEVVVFFNRLRQRADYMDVSFKLDTGSFTMQLV